ncbi:MAG: HlyD family efflux transporter periplasmic adaptor subunit [Thermoflexales bacterium]|nr:HlyD family efflux transporter periplasmic adaptor subunit [Thermoflexales bacterium]
MNTRTAAATAALMLTLSACALPVAAPPTPTPAPEVPQPSAPTFRAQRGLIIRGAQFNARAQPKEAQPLAFDIDGKVRKVNVRATESVKAGQVLAELDLTDVRTQIQQETIKYNTARTVLSETMQAYTRTVRLAELDLEQAQLRLASAETRATHANVDLLAADLARNGKLIEDIKTSIANARAAGNQAGADNAQKLLTAAEVERERLTASYQSALAEVRGKEIDLGLLRNEVERARINLSAKIAALDPALIQAVETSRVALEALKAKELRGSLISPIDGDVTALSLAVGDNVKALDIVAVVARPGDLEIVAALSDAQLQEVALGLPVIAYLSTEPNKAVDGVVTRVPTLSVTSKDKLVRIGLAANARIEAGVVARCEVILGRRENAIWLPPQAIRNFRGRKYVVVIDPGGAQRRADVIIGLESAERVEIIDGVKEGELVQGE